jgi:CRP-like cAMP-binding protein
MSADKEKSVAGLGSPLSYHRSDNIYLPDYLVTDPSVYLILEGEVQIIHKYNPIQKEVFQYKKGDLFGLLELYTGTRRITSAVATTELHCIAFTRENFEKAMIGNLNFAISAIKIMSRMLRQVNGRIKTLN